MIKIFAKSFMILFIIIVNIVYLNVKITFLKIDIN